MPSQPFHAGTNGEQVLHMYIPKDEVKQGRTNLSADYCPLQVASIRENKDRKYPAHKHLMTFKESIGTQESWVCISGSVEAQLYDTHDNWIGRVILSPGDILISFGGGHSYKILEDNTVVYEFKSGPYLGKEHDKIEIEGTTC